MIVDFVCATRLAQREFWTKGALGLSLQRLGRNGRQDAHVSFENTRGLPEIYNERIDAAPEQDILVFAHDDIWVNDFFIYDQLRLALSQFDVVGVAGSRSRVPGQAGWGYLDERLKPVHWQQLSGMIAHSKEPWGPVDWFGPTPAECELLDGVFLAARAGRLREAGVRFDPQFDFHFYDIDFCRSARQAGLRLGTWPIALTHQSKGAFVSEHWRGKYAAYLQKWGETAPAKNGP